MGIYRNFIEPLKARRELLRIVRIDDDFLIAHHPYIQRSCNRILFLLDVLDPKKPELSIHAYFMEREENWMPYQTLYGHTTVKDYLHSIIGRICIDDIQPAKAQGRTSIEMVLYLYRSLCARYGFPPRYIQGNHYTVSYWEQEKHITYISDLLKLIEKRLTQEVTTGIEKLYPRFAITNDPE